MLQRKFSYLTFFYSCLTTLATAEYQLPSYMKTCSKSDPNFNQCMIDNSVAAWPHLINGDRKLNLPSLNPLIIEKIEVHQGNRQIGLNMVVTEVQAFGLEGIYCKDLDLNMDTKQLKTHASLPRLQIVGHHKTSGNIMMVKVEGEGKFNITAVGIEFIYETAFDYETRADGEKYAVTKEQHLKITDAKRVYFDLEGMMGNGKLDAAVNDMLNQHWKVLTYDLFEEIADQLIDVTKLILNLILGGFPVGSVVKD